MQEVLNLTGTWAGILSLFIFLVSYFFIMTEVKYKVNKSIPALFMGTGMFIIIGFYFVLNGLDLNLYNHEINKVILEVVEIVFFLFVAITFIEVLVERNVFEVLKQKLLIKRYDYKILFWIIGFLGFFLSPIVDNLTTSLILVTLIITISKEKKFLLPTAINIVVAANAGGVWSPFGDITTLMAWTGGKAGFMDFFLLFPAAFLGWLSTSYILSLFVIDGYPKEVELEKKRRFKKGARRIILLGLFTIFFAVAGHQILHLPPMWGMMFGFAILKVYTYSLYRKGIIERTYIYESMRKVEMETLLFFFGLLAGVGALSFLGYLVYVSYFYDTVGSLFGNTVIGMFSSVLGNVPVMSSVLKSDINMGLDGWLLLTLTVGIGGSLISFGSAAGIGVMGKLKGIYNFNSHMKFFPAIIIGYFVSILVFYIQFYVF